MLSFMLSTWLSSAALLAPSEGPGAPQDLGPSLQIPTFDPSQSFEQVARGISGFSDVAEAIREATEVLQKAHEEYKINPTKANQGKLERALASMTLNLAREIRRATTSREKVIFAFQDLQRGVRSIHGSVERFAKNCQQRAEGETRELDSVNQAVGDLAEEWVNADDEDKVALLERFKSAYRKRGRLTYRAHGLQNLSQHYGRLALGVDRLALVLESVSDRVEDVFDRMADAGEMIAFAAGLRRDTTGLVAMYNQLMGDGNHSVKNVLDHIQKVRGQLEIFDSVTADLNDSGALVPLLTELSTLVPGISEVASGGTGIDMWENRVHEVLEGMQGRPSSESPAGQ